MKKSILILGFILGLIPCLIFLSSISQKNEEKSLSDFTFATEDTTTDSTIKKQEDNKKNNKPKFTLDDLTGEWVCESLPVYIKNGYTMLPDSQGHLYITGSVSMDLAYSTDFSWKLILYPASDVSIEDDKVIPDEDAKGIIKYLDMDNKKMRYSVMEDNIFVLYEIDPETKEANINYMYQIDEDSDRYHLILTNRNDPADIISIFRKIN